MQERNAELREALEHQTATSEVLGIISRSPTDVQPVLDAIVESAARVCGIDDVLLRLREGNNLVARAHFGSIPIRRGEIGMDQPQHRWMREHGTLHIPDARAQNDFPMVGSVGGSRTFLLVPLRQQGELIGLLAARRIEVRPFSPAQIKLLETFADQAVIAIENVRLFQELQERLEQQTATSEILSVIASSPTDLQPVLDVVAESAARLCDASDSLIMSVVGENFHRVAQYGRLPSPALGVPIRISRGLPGGLAVLDRRTIHIDDVATEIETKYPDARNLQQEANSRTILATPLLREGIAIGVIIIRRTEVRPFTDKQITLLKTFADQAVIAIENARLFQELTQKTADLETSNSELREALERQTATGEILGVIASSPTDIQPVLDVVAEYAARLCDATDAVIQRVDGDVLRRVAHYGQIPATTVGEELTITRALLPGRTILDRQALHVHDLAIAVETEFPEDKPYQQRFGVRTIVVTPLLREGVPIGTIVIRRTEVRPFSEKQIALLKTFADQAVIAIENVRLFKELEDRNRQLTEALEQQTATSDILSVISSAPTDLQPVFNTIAEHSVALCGALFSSVYRFDGELIHMVAHHNYPPVALERSRQLFPTRPGRHLFAARAILERGVIHVPDAAQDPEHAAPDLADAARFRSVLSVPMLRGGEPIGAINVWHAHVGPFSQKHVALLQTFANQAVIAIENARLFQELQARNRDLTEALEQQTATSEILRVIASSPTDIQPVLDAVAESAARLCDANDALINRIDGDVTYLVAILWTYSPHWKGEDVPFSRAAVQGRAIIDRQTVHVHDLAVVVDTEFPESKILQQRRGTRTILATPLLREGVPVGVILIRRLEVRPFTDRQIKLLETFAAQAVIAIENVRLFQELGERNAELHEALEHQTATAEVLGIISRSPTDVQPVLDAIVESAARVCGIDDVVLRLREGNAMVPRAHFGPIPIPASRSVLMSQLSLDARAWHAPRSRCPRAERFPKRGFRRRLAHLFGCSPSSARGTRWNTDRTSYRGASLHPGADQAPRNFRRPGGHRHRERPAIPRVEGIVGAADCDE